MCDIIWCKKEVGGKVCDTVNYLDPYCFWNWEGKIGCAECGTVYYIHMIQGHMYRGPDEKAGEKPARGWRPQPPSTGVAGSCGFFWDIEKLSPEVWKEYQEKIKKGEVKDW